MLVTLVNCQVRISARKDDLVGIICRKFLKALEFRRDTGVLIAAMVEMGRLHKPYVHLTKHKLAKALSFKT